VTMFAGVCIWTSVHLMPIDLYGVERAAFTYSLLDGVLALSQTATSPAIGAMVDHFGFTPVCVLMPMLPLAGLATLRICLGRR